MNPTTTIRPGILVALKSSVQGGVTYNRVDLDADAAQTAATEGAKAERWETTKIVTDPAELERATKVRSAALAEVTKVCVRTSFGLLAPAAAEQALNDAYAKARALVEAHNAGAVHTRVQIHMLKGRIASTDEEAARAIASELEGLLRDMDRGVRQLDPEAIRAAASKAMSMGAVLDEGKAAMVTSAVEAARAAARVIVKRVQKAGEDGAQVLADLQTADIEKARMAFLDLDTPAEVTANDADASPALPAVELQRTSDLDFEPAPETAKSAGAPAAPAAEVAAEVAAPETPAETPVHAPAESGPTRVFDLDLGDDADDVEVFNAM